MFKKITNLITLFLLLSPSSLMAKPERYEFDKEHTTILFFVNHLGFSNKVGQFRQFSGYFIFDNEHPENSYIDVTFNPAGIDSGSEILDKKLQEKNWFNSASYPEINYKSFKVNLTGNDTAEVKGWLIIRGIRKRVTLEVKLNKEGNSIITGEHIAGFSIDTTFKRSLFGMISDIPLVGDDVRMHIEAEGIRK